ncbi:hypothetical protein BJX63DRAFT_422323 [Aspergillus granulosus]|uniref:Thioesterase domain-containing protein n=1 Tax=Aspergillus granulosus TaxID=176169 RepID=A0ABR4H7P2_9EURO
MDSLYNTSTTAEELVDHFAAVIKDKVILTTGPSPASIGATFVKTVARAQPALIILAGRSTSKLQQTAGTITKEHPSVPIRLLQLDLGSLSAVQEAAGHVNSWDDVPCVDVLVNNAGIMATDFALSPEGYESQFATNHLGHFLFTNLIIDKILASRSPRIVNVSSDGHRLSPIRWADTNFREGETYNRWSAYGQSKTANILMAVSLAEKLGPKGLLAYSLHPGVIFGTGLTKGVRFEEMLPELIAVDRFLGNEQGWRRDISAKTPQQGAATTVYAAFDPSLKEFNGKYLDDCHVANPWTDTLKPWATNKVEAERLWKLSEQLVGQEPSFLSKMADDTAHFQSIPWVAALLRDPTFTTTPFPSRVFKSSTEDSFFATTINTPTTISACLTQYRTPPPNAKPFRPNAIPTNEIRTFATLGSDLNGWPGVLHGGMVATLLDECMGLILSYRLGGGESGQEGPFTAFLNIKFLRQVITPGTVVVSTRITEEEIRKWKIEGDIRDGEGTNATEQKQKNIVKI